MRTRRRAIISRLPGSIQNTLNSCIETRTESTTPERSFSQYFYFSMHILAFHTASQAELVALMPHQTFNIGFPPPENLTPRSLGWSFQSRQSELLNKEKVPLQFSGKLSCSPYSSAEVIDASNETIIFNNSYLPATRFLGFCHTENCYTVILRQAS